MSYHKQAIEVLSRFRPLSRAFFIVVGVLIVGAGFRESEMHGIHLFLTLLATLLVVAGFQALFYLCATMWIIEQTAFDNRNAARDKTVCAFCAILSFAFNLGVIYLLKFHVWADRRAQFPELFQPRTLIVLSVVALSCVLLVGPLTSKKE